MPQKPLKSILPCKRLSPPSVEIGRREFCLGTMGAMTLSLPIPAWGQDRARDELAAYARDAGQEIHVALIGAEAAAGRGSEDLLNALCRRHPDARTRAEWKSALQRSAREDIEQGDRVLVMGVRLARVEADFLALASVLQRDADSTYNSCAATPGLRLVCSRS